MEESSRKIPFTLSFGRPPAEYIRRVDEYDRIMETFTHLPFTDQIYIITGIRGSGKTVFFYSLLKAFREMDDWIIVPLDTYDDMAECFYSELFHALKHHTVKTSAEVNLPHTGISLSLSTEGPEKTLRSRIGDLLRTAARQGKKVLAAVDEVSKSKSMKRFAKIFQEMIGNELPLYFLGTGIFENIEELQDVKDLTFLYRAPRIVLEPLDLSAIALRYQQTFEIQESEANTLAKMTKGYPFAFQALGYTYWEHLPVSDPGSLLPDYDRILTGASYSKLWKEMSELDRKVCRAVADHDGEKVKEIRQEAGMDSNLFNTYRVRLKERGIIDTSVYGRISFTLD